MNVIFSNVRTIYNFCKILPGQSEHLAFSNVIKVAIFILTTIKAWPTQTTHFMSVFVTIISSSRPCTCMYDTMILVII